MQSPWTKVGMTAAVLAVVVMVSFGLCGVAISTRKLPSLAVGGAIGVSLGCLGLVICGVIAVVMAIAATVRTPPPPPPIPPPPVPPDGGASRPSE